jgi:hypothetical protein
MWITYEELKDVLETVLIAISIFLVLKCLLNPFP